MFTVWGLLPPPPVFSQVFILKGDKVVCFDTLLEVFILKGLTLHQNCARVGVGRWGDRGSEIGEKVLEARRVPEWEFWIHTRKLS
jgi:hypothetical protein